MYEPNPLLKKVSLKERLWNAFCKETVIHNHGGRAPHEIGPKKKSKNRFFKKFSYFTHMIWVVPGPAWGCCFNSIKVCSSHTNSLRKSKKTAKKLLFLACEGPLTEDGLENSNFQAVFSILSKSSCVPRKLL